MVALLRKSPMQRNSGRYERVVSEAVAARVVDDLIVEMVRAGFDGEQAKAAAKAAQEYLVSDPGYELRAKDALSKAGFVNGVAEELLSDIRAAVESAKAIA